MSEIALLKEQDILKLSVIILIVIVGLGLCIAVTLVRTTVKKWGAVILWFIIFGVVSIAVIFAASSLPFLENVPLFVFTASTIKIVSLAGISFSLIDWIKENKSRAHTNYAKFISAVTFVVAILLCIRIICQVVSCTQGNADHLGHVAAEILEIVCKDSTYEIMEKSVYMTILWNLLSLLPIILLASINVWLLIADKDKPGVNLDGPRRFFFSVDFPCLLAALTVFIYIFVARLNVHHQDATLFVSGAMTFLVFTAFWAEKLILATTPEVAILDRPN